MTTDATELTQLRAELSNPAVGGKDHLRKLALSLVEALEKAQETEKTLKSRNRRLEGIIDTAEMRIAELETIRAAAEKLVRRKGRYSSTLDELAQGIRALHPNAGNSPVIPDGLVKAVAFYEQVKREIPPLETGAWKDAIDWVLKEACGVAMLQVAEQPQYAQQNIPEGYALVPIEPTESMIIDGFESEPDKFFSKPEEWKAYEAMSGCQQAAHRAKLCWAAMIAAVPKREGG